MSNSHTPRAGAVSRTARTALMTSRPRKVAIVYERDTFLIYASKRVPLSRFLRFFSRESRRWKPAVATFFVRFPVKLGATFDHRPRDSRRPIPFYHLREPLVRVRAGGKSLYDVGKAPSVVLEVFRQPPPSLRARAGSPLAQPLRGPVLHLSVTLSLAAQLPACPELLLFLLFICLFIYIFNYIFI